MSSAEEDFIDGVYNYCDRWCERCSLTGRCRLFAMEEEAVAKDPAARDPSNAAFWRVLEDIFKQTIQMLHEIAESEGIDLTADEPAEQVDRKPRRLPIEETLAHPLVAAAHDYAQQVNVWFKASHDCFEEKRDELTSRVTLGLQGRDPEDEVIEIADATEVIRWYQFQIAVKLARAVSGKADDAEEPDEEMAEFPSDVDGSAKVALLGIDRSLAAWSLLRQSLAGQEDAILDFLVRLDRIRRSAERLFPRARAFARPGFDEEPAVQP